MARLRTLAPLLVAAVLATVAVVTVERAGCSDPGHLERTSDGYVLVGGCIAPGDLPVAEPAPAPPGPAPAPTDVLPARS